MKRILTAAAFAAVVLGLVPVVASAQVVASTSVAVIATSVSTTTSTSWLIANTVPIKLIRSIDISWDTDTSTAPTRLTFYQNVIGTAYKVFWDVWIPGTEQTGVNIITKEFDESYLPYVTYGLQCIQTIGTAAGKTRGANEILVNVKYR